MLRFSLEKPIVLLIGILIICMFGLAALFRTPIQMVPDLDPRLITVETRWPGATPQNIEQEIIIEQEEFLRGLKGLDRMYSSAEFGRARIELEFPFSVDINEALVLVNNALSQVASYPENVDEPRITADSFSDNPFMFWGIYYKDQNRDDIAEMLDWVEDNIKPRMERVDGVAALRLRGGASRQVHIRLDPGALASRGLRLMDVRNALRLRNRDISGGDMDFGKRRYFLRTLGRFENIQQLNDLIIAERDGAFIRLKDVGEAVMAHDEVRAINRTNGIPSIGAYITKIPGANVVEIKQNILQVVEQINQDLLAPRGMEMLLFADDVQYIEHSIATVTKNLLIGAVLAVAVLMLFLRSVSATLIGTIGIPVCILAAFLGLLVAGRSINVISLTGIAFAIGMTLDNSIVAMENISRHLSMGKSRFDAALEGIREVWPAIIASTLTTVMVFLPIVFLDLEAGQLYSDIAVAISASILMSMIVAMTLIPPAASRFLSVANLAQPKQPTAGWLQRLNDRGSNIAQSIQRLTSWLLKTKNRQVGTVIGCLFITAFVLKFLTPAAEYLPEGEESKIIGRLLAPPGYNIDTMNKVLDQLDPDFAASVGIAERDHDPDSTAIPPLHSHYVIMYPGVIIFVTEPVSVKYTPELIDKTLERFRAIPAMRSFVVRGSIFSDNRGGSRSINLELSGGDLETLYGTAINVIAEADSLFEGGQINADPSPPTLRMSQPMANILPDWERAAELGISQDELGYSLWAYSDGAYVDEYLLDDKKVDMLLFASRGQVNRPADLENLTLYTPQGEQVPVSVLARVEERASAAKLSRIDGVRTVTLQILPPRAIALEDAVNQVKQNFLPRLRSEQIIPGEVEVSISGATSQLEQTRSALSISFLMAVAIAYLLLVAVFSHWGFPLIIMTSVPIGIAGGILGIGLFNLITNHLDLIGLQPYHQPFDVITMLGFLILIGTVVNNPILIVERAQHNINQKGMAIIQGVEEAVKLRLKPVMMSTMTTICGLSPLVLLPGEGAELYRGLGAVVLAGLLVSSLVTLTILPVIIALVFEFKEKLSRTKRPDSN